MNTTDYLDLTELEMAQNGGQPMPPSGQPQKAWKAVTAANTAPGFDNFDAPHPVRRGALEAVDSAMAAQERMYQKSMQRQMKNSSFLNDALYNLGSAYLQQSAGIQMPNLQAQREARAQQDAKQAFQLMEEMRHAEHARMQDERQRQHYEELARHNLSQEEMMRPYYEAQTHKFKKEELEELKNLKLQEKYPEAKTFASMPKNSVNDAMKELRTRANKPVAERVVLRTLDEMNTLVSDHPDLSTSFSAMIMPDKHASLASSALRKKFVNKKDRVALERLEKLAASLVGKEVKGLGQTRGNLFLEKMMAASNPHAGLTPEAVKYIRDDFKREHEHSTKDAELARAGIAQGFYAPMLMEEEEPAANTTSVIINGVKRPLTGNITPERLQELQAKGYEVVND